MTQRPTQPDRRRALKAIGLGVGATAIAGQTVHASPAPIQQATSSADTRYRASKHVLTYYATLSEKEV